MAPPEKRTGERGHTGQHKQIHLPTTRRTDPQKGRLTSVTVELPPKDSPTLSSLLQHPVRPSCELSCRVAGHLCRRSREQPRPRRAINGGAHLLRRHAPTRASGDQLSPPSVAGWSPLALDAVLGGDAKLEAISGRPAGPSPLKTPSQIKSVRQHAAESRQRLAT